MKISAKSQYGLRAMVYLARSENIISPLKEISEKEGIPFNYLEKIVSKLEKEGLVGAKKGVHGGYFLKRPPKKITVGEIMETLDGEMVLVKCIAEKKDGKFSCGRERTCLTKNVWGRIQDILRITLNKITLYNLISPEGNRTISRGVK